MHDAYLCDLLKLSYTELEKQPESWIEKMVIWYKQKAKAEKVLREAKEGENK